MTLDKKIQLLKEDIISALEKKLLEHSLRDIEQMAFKIKEANPNLSIDLKKKINEILLNKKRLALFFNSVRNLDETNRKIIIDLIIKELNKVERIGSDSKNKNGEVIVDKSLYRFTVAILNLLLKNNNFNNITGTLFEKELENELKKYAAINDDNQEKIKYDIVIKNNSGENVFIECKSTSKVKDKELKIAQYTPKQKMKNKIEILNEKNLSLDENHFIALKKGNEIFFELFRNINNSLGINTEKANKEYRIVLKNFNTNIKKDFNWFKQKAKISPPEIKKDGSVEASKIKEI